MPKKTLLLLIAAIVLWQCENLFSQYEDVKWTLDPSTQVKVTGQYVDLPQSLYFQNPNTSERVLTTQFGSIVIGPSFRPFPHSATQSEVEVTTQTGNPNIIFASWNSFGPSFYGTGFTTSINGGTTWTGNHQMFTPNSGDPAPWVWPTGSTWAGRYGMSVISHAAYSANNGTTWSTPVAFSPGGGGAFDKNFSAVDDVSGSPFFGRAYTVWTDFSGASWRIRISFTTDGGVTWSSATYVSPPTSPGHHHQGCDVKVGPGGDVHVVWANCTTNGQNSTEDSLGYARSTDGGVSWVFASNSVADMNGIRTSNLFNGIRCNGFPRLDIDKTGGPRNGWLYVVAGEKNFAPALDNSDIVLMRSTNNGAAWTRSRVNQDPSGKLNYMAAVRVDECGGVNVVYYDQRNVAATLAEVYMSRSFDGGTTWSDLKVSDHSFTPGPIPGLAGGYQGDYIGVTSTGTTVWPFWADNFSGIYQVWTAKVNVGPDLWAKDTWADVGDEPNPDNGAMWISEDIWVRNQQDGFANPHMHQNPEYRDSILYPYNPNFIYVMVRNRGGCYASGQLKTYWAKASTGLNWPTQWINYFVGPVLSGNIIHTSMPIISNLAPGDSAIFEIPWFPPNPSDFASYGADSSHFCLLARIETSPVSPFGMTFPEVPSIYTNVKNNNNIVWKNITVVNNFTGPNGPMAAGWVTVRNVEREAALIKLRFRTPKKDHDNPFLKYGRIFVELGDRLFERWRENNMNGEGVRYLEGTTIEVLKLDAFIDMKMEAEEMATIKFGFDLDEQPSEGKDQFNLQLEQYAVYEGREVIAGGENFALDTRIKKKGEEEQQDVKQFSTSVYPNPFNPTTNISYSLPKDALVKIKIYDILGREVANLVNEFKTTGTYSVRFNGDNLASGVYFYTIQAGEFRETKKLLLVR
jgi:hypothetical protein